MTAPALASVQLPQPRGSAEPALATIGAIVEDPPAPAPGRAPGTPPKGFGPVFESWVPRSAVAHLGPGRTGTTPESPPARPGPEPSIDTPSPAIRRLTERRPAPSLAPFPVRRPRERSPAGDAALTALAAAASPWVAPTPTQTAAPRAHPEAAVAPIPSTTPGQPPARPSASVAAQPAAAPAPTEVVAAPEATPHAAPPQVEGAAPDEEPDEETHSRAARRSERAAAGARRPVADDLEALPVTWSREVHHPRRSAGPAPTPPTEAPAPPAAETTTPGPAGVAPGSPERPKQEVEAVTSEPAPVGEVPPATEPSAPSRGPRNVERPAVAASAASLPPEPTVEARVELRPEVHVEVRAHGTRVDVVVHTTPDQVGRYQDLGSELAASLESGGFDLGGFSARGDRRPKEEATAMVTIPRGSRSSGARRGGRYA